MKLLIVALLAAPLLAWAGCPNACSGHGSCGQYDSCVCHTNWQGGDCSERVCMYNWAWVAGSNGDLNMDGDIYDGTAYHDDYSYVTGGIYLQTDASPSGTWEMWPATHVESHDDGHFYMECSNRGLCDRDSGLCKCFEGYEGEACRRSTCPNNCGGHGVCLTVSQLLADAGTGYTYTLWDRDMNRACSCDPGFIGSDCSESQCPMGDDPLTKSQTDEIQFIEITSTCAAATCGGALGGSATFSYTDPFGESWETDPVNIVSYDGSDTAVAMAAALEAALEAIPNDVFTDVTVTAGYCEKILPNRFADYVAGGGDAYTGATATGNLRCPGFLDGADDCSHVLADLAGSGFVVLNGKAADSGYCADAVGAAFPTNGADQTCHHVPYEHCVRFQIELSTNPGDIELITADITDVTRNSKTNTMDAASLVATTSAETLIIVDDATALFEYYLTASASVENTDSTGTITPGTKTITFGGSPSNTAFSFPVGSSFELFCDTRSLGIYTASAETVAGADLITVEAIVADNAPCANDADGVVKAVLQTHFIKTNVDYSQMDIVGKVLDLTAATGNTVTTVASTQYDDAGNGAIFFEGDTSLSGTTTSITGDLYINGAGTKENNECSDRGLCDRSSGTCKCFKGYTGEACSSQSELFA